MSQPGFYNDNRNRAYPFLKGSVAGVTASSGTIEKLDNNTIVDAGFVVGLYSGFVEGEHSVWLESIVRSGTTLTFRFESDAPGLFNRPLLFTRIVTDGDYLVEHVEDADYPANESQYSDSAFEEVSDEAPGECPPEPLWTGFLVTGYLTNLLAALPGNGAIVRATDSGGVVEAALIQNMANSYVDSINLANDDRTRVTDPNGCDNTVFPFPTGLTYVTAKCLRGNVRFSPGYNAAIRQEDFNNAIVFGAAIGAGAGSQCNDEPLLFPGEVPPNDSSLLEGGPLCNQVVRSINGVGGQFANLLGGLGVIISTDPSTNTVIVNVNMNRLTVCYSDTPFSEVSERV